MDIETYPGRPAQTRVVVDKAAVVRVVVVEPSVTHEEVVKPAVPAMVSLELSQAEVLLIAAALAHIPVSLLDAVGLGGNCCDQLVRAAGLDDGAWIDVLTPEDGRLDMGRNWAKNVEPLLNQ